MKNVLTVAVCFLFLTGPAYGQEEKPPFALTHFGNFQKMIHSGRVTGVVNLREALALPHLYAVGALAGAAGEITVMDGNPWLDYGSDGLGNARHVVPATEEALLLVRAQVADWREITLPGDMDEPELHGFILAQAEKNGINVTKPFPFLLDGSFQEVSWHVVNGLRSEKNKDQGEGLLRKEKEHRPMAAGRVIGFYAGASQGVFTHPGESWHLHIVFPEENQAGHLDGLAVRQGTRLQLPATDFDRRK